MRILDLYKDIWWAATFGMQSPARRVARQYWRQVDVTHACQLIIEYQEPTSLRELALLLHGIVLIHQQQCQQTYASIQHLLADIKKALLWKDLLLEPYTKLDQTKKFDAITVPIPSDDLSLLLSPTYSQIHQWYCIPNLLISNDPYTTQSVRLSSNGNISIQPITYANSLQRIATPEEQRQMVLGDNYAWRVSDELYDPLNLPVNYPETPVNLVLREDGELHEIVETTSMATLLVDAPALLPPPSSSSVDVWPQPGLQNILLPAASPFVNSNYNNELYNVAQLESLFNQSTVEAVNAEMIQEVTRQQQQEQHHRRRQRRFNWHTWLDSIIEVDVNQLFSSLHHLTQYDDITLRVTRQQKLKESTISPWLMTSAISLYNDELNDLWEVNMQMMLQPQTEGESFTHHSISHRLPLNYPIHVQSEESILNPPDDLEQMRGHTIVVDNNIDPMLIFGAKMPWDPVDDLPNYGTAATSEHTDRLPGLSTAMMGAWTTTATTTLSMPGGIGQPRPSSGSLRQLWIHTSSERGSLGVQHAISQPLITDQPSSVLSGGLPSNEANRTRSLFPNQEPSLLPIQHQDTENFYRYLCRIAVHTGHCLSFQQDILPKREMTRTVAAQGLHHLLILASTRRLIVWQNNSMEDIMVDLVVTV